MRILRWLRKSVDTVVLYILGIGALLVLDAIGVGVPQNVITVVACFGALGLILTVRQAGASGVYRKLGQLEAELARAHRLNFECDSVPLHGVGGVVQQLADALVDSFLDQMEDQPPEEIEQVWARDLRAALQTACRKVPYFFDSGKRMLTPRKIAIVRMPPTAVRDRFTVAAQAPNRYMQTCDLVVGLWDDGSAAAGKTFIEGPIEIIVTPARLLMHGEDQGKEQLPK